MNNVLSACKSFFMIFFLGFFVAIPTLFCFETAHAAQIKAVKGNRAIVDTEGDALQNGDYFYILSPTNKKRGILKIVKVKGKKALAYVGRGKAKKGDSLLARQRTQRKNSQPLATTGDPKSGGPTGSYWGIMAGFSMASADVTLTDSSGNSAGSVSLDGNGFSAKAFFDYPLLPWLWFRGLGGIEQFSVSGGSNANCAASTCETDVTYLSADFWGRIPFGGGQFKPWIGAGFDILFPMSKDSTAIRESSISNSSLAALGVGFDWFLNNQSYIPVSIEYGMFPSSDQVDAHMIMLRGGYGMSF